MGIRSFLAFELPAGIQERLRGIGAFPHWRRPKVMWAGLNGDIEKLSRLRNTLNDELELLGFKAEKRPYRPHLTLGRFKGPVKRNEDLRLIIEARFTN